MQKCYNTLIRNQPNLPWLPCFHFFISSLSTTLCLTIYTASCFFSSAASLFLYLRHEQPGSSCSLVCHNYARYACLHATDCNGLESGRGVFNVRYSLRACCLYIDTDDPAQVFTRKSHKTVPHSATTRSRTLTTRLSS